MPVRSEARSRRAVLALVSLSAAAFCFVTAEVLPIGLLPLISGDLRHSESTTGLLVTGYAVVVLVASVPLVWLTRRVVRRHLLAGTLAAFTVATLLSASAPSYSVLLGARLCTALAQALFWSVVASTAVGLFPPAVRGRVVARLAVGSAVAPVIGVPSGVWLGQTAGWRVPFLALAGVAALTSVAVLATLPRQAPEGGEVIRGATPDRRAYAVLLLVTGVSVTGAMATFTYIVPFLRDVSAFAPATLAPLLLAAGVAGIAGTVVIGAVLERRPRYALLMPLATVTVALSGLAAFGTVQPVAVAGLVALGFGFNALPPALQRRTLDVAPNDTDVASAGTSAVFNAGIAIGSLLGGALLSGPGARAVPVLGAASVAVALLVTVKAGRVRRVRDTASPVVMGERKVAEVGIAA